jgi:hypothetical protein
VFYATMGVKPLHPKSSSDLATIIAAHDPHQETVRLLDEALKLATMGNLEFVAERGDQKVKAIRAHLARVKGTQ